MNFTRLDVIQGDLPIFPAGEDAARVRVEAHTGFTLLYKNINFQFQTSKTLNLLQNHFDHCELVPWYFEEKTLPL